jgi:adenine specific DNA methylase Mod
MIAFHSFLRGSDMMAYLAMMAPRLVELQRVLKETGSIYLHCDPTASHYLKLLMDAVFVPHRFRSEIVWKRSSAHSDTKQAENSMAGFMKSSCFTQRVNRGLGIRRTRGMTTSNFGVSTNTLKKERVAATAWEI